MDTRGCTANQPDMNNEPWWMTKSCSQDAAESLRMAQGSDISAPSLRTISQMSRSNASSNPDAGHSGSGALEQKQRGERCARQAQAQSEASQSEDRQAACFPASRAASSAAMAQDAADHEANNAGISLQENISSDQSKVSNAYAPTWLRSRNSTLGLVLFLLITKCAACNNACLA